MAIHKGVGMRTPRTRAIEIGTDPAGFAGGVDMEGDPARAGHPALPGLPVSTYKEQAPAIAGTSPSQGVVPYSNLKRGK